MVKTKMDIKVIKQAYHRNGVGGIGFNVVIFKTQGDSETRNRKMLGVVFPESGAVAVFDIAELAKDNIEFAQGNSWRGDHFETGLREAIKLTGD